MSTVERMISAHPLYNENNSRLVDCIHECLHCAAVCTSCADACLAEPDIAALRHCIELNQTCADLCEFTARFMSRFNVNDAELQRQVLAACAQACRICAAECEMHAGHMQHCAICAETCRKCEAVCSGYESGNSAVSSAQSGRVF
jgi:hypothetical protein